MITTQRRRTRHLRTATWRRARVGLGAAGIVAAFLAPGSTCRFCGRHRARDNMVALSAADRQPRSRPQSFSPAEASTLTSPTDAVTLCCLPGRLIRPPSHPRMSNICPARTICHRAPPPMRPQGKMDYLRYLWNAMRSQGSNAQ